MDLNPRSTSELSELLRRDLDGSISIVGGGSTDGVRLGGDHTLHTGALDGIIAYEPADLTITCGVGTTLAEVQRTLSAGGQWLPLFHPAGDRATIGGLVAYGWTGLGTRLWSRLRDLVLEVAAVTGDGRLVRGGGRVVKNVTGFDLPRLFFGSRGSLGVLAELTLKVHPTAEPLYARAARGRAVELAAELLRGIEETRMPVEAVLIGGREHGWTARVWAEAPSDDAARLLAPFPGGEDDGDLADAASDPVLVGRGGAIGVRAAVPRAGLLEGCAALSETRRALIDMGSGLAWAVLETEGEVRTLRQRLEAVGGSCVLTRAPEATRDALGVYGAEPQGAEIMRRIKASFDPARILPPLPIT